MGLKPGLQLFDLGEDLCGLGDDLAVDAEAEEARIPGYYEIIEKIVNEIEL